MDYDVITIDTCIFDEKGLMLESGLLGQLVQFNKGSAEFVIPDVILQEIQRHLLANTKNAKDSLLKVPKKIKDHLLLDEDLQEKLSQILENVSPAEDIVKARLELFIENTGLEILDCQEYVEVKEILQKYHNIAPPFAEEKGKKAEFPDAFALICLENWGKKNDKKILAVSKDRGWKAFGDGSSQVDVIEDLESALEKFNDGVSKARTTANLFMKQLLDGDKPDTIEKINETLEDEIPMLSAYAEANSSFYYEEEQVSLVFLDFTFLANSFDEGNIHLVRVGRNRIVVWVPINVKIQAFATFSFSIYDSIDKDYVPMGSEDVETEDEIQCELLLTLDDQEDSVELLKVELLSEKNNPTIDFGFIDPDWGNPDEPYW